MIGSAEDKSTKKNLSGVLIHKGKVNGPPAKIRLKTIEF